MKQKPWLSVRNWRRFQVYSDRNPPWVKWATAQLDDDELCTLRTETRLFWSLIVLVAARRENVIPNDGAWLAVECSMPKRAVTRALNELIQAGFVLGFDSKADCVAADRDAKKVDAASRDARTETETEKARDLHQEGLSSSNGSEEALQSPAAAHEAAQPADRHVCEASTSEGDLCGASFDTLRALAIHRHEAHQLGLEAMPADVEELVERWSGETA